jgi:hypothetical protein
VARWAKSGASTKCFYLVREGNSHRYVLGREVNGLAFYPFPSSSLLACILTPYAVSRPRNCLQPFRFDFGSALGTLAESTLAYPLHRIGQSSDRLSCEISLVRKSLSLIFRRSLISRIRMPRRTCPHLLLGIGEDTLRFRNTGLQQLSKMLGLLGRQHVLTFGTFLNPTEIHYQFSPGLAIMQPSFVGEATMTHQTVTLKVIPCLRVECKFWLNDGGCNGSSMNRQRLFKIAASDRRGPTWNWRWESISRNSCTRVARVSQNGQHKGSRQIKGITMDGLP